MSDNDGLRSRSLVFPVILILVGGVFLYRNWHPAFSPWPVLKAYWPLILIFVGLGKMWDATQGAKQSARPGVSIGSTVAVLLFVLVIVVLMWRSPSFADRNRSGHLVDHISEARDLQGVTSLNAVVTITAGELNLSGGTARAFEGEFDYATSWARPQIEYNLSGKSAELNITQENHGPLLGPDNTWWLRLNDQVPLDLQIKMGAAKGDLNFRDINLKKLHIEGGVGKIDVDLTGKRSSDLDVDIHGGIGQAVIRLPKNVGVVVEAKGGIGAVTTNGLKKEDGTYVNDAYKKSPHTVHVTVEGGIGSIDLSLEH